MSNMIPVGDTISVAIETHYVSPTNWKGPKIKAVSIEENKDDVVRVHSRYDYTFSIVRNHLHAAILLMEKMAGVGWENAFEYTGKYISTGTGYIFLFDRID